MPRDRARSRLAGIAPIIGAKALLVFLAVHAQPALADPRPAPDAGPACDERAVRLRVPVDHDRPDAGTWTLTYLLAGPFEPGRPTVFAVADGQQFFIRPGRMRQVADRTCRGDVNVVGIPGRIIAEELADLVADDDGRIDWPLAARVFGSRQWCGDIDAVRRHLLGADARILIVGGSGGGLLVQEYLARHGEHCARAFIEAGVNPVLAARRDLVPDRFWEELGAQDPDLPARLQAGLARLPDQRGRIATAFSRQHYFHTAAGLDSARAALVEVIARGDRAALDAVCRRYQVDAVHDLVAGKQGLAVAVRMFEFYLPFLRSPEPDDARFHPTLEMGAALARPLLEAHAAGAVPAPDFPVDRLASVAAEVFLLAGRWDQPVDWRIQQDLAGLLPNSLLFLADDDHLFKGLRAEGLDADLREAFLLHGLGSPQLATALARAEANRWRP